MHTATAPETCEAPASATPSAPIGTTTALRTRGWDLVRGLFDAHEVQLLRDTITAAFAATTASASAPADCGRVVPDLFTLPEVAALVCVPKLFAAMRRLMGDDLVLLPEHCVHREGFGGWHKDTDMFERAGQVQHWSADFEVFQCAIYLQDNTPLHGGGLSVVPGSHLQPRPPVTLIDPAQRDQWYAAQTQQALDSRAGDLVAFNTRLDHRATPRQAPSPEGAKLALFFIVSRANRHAQLYSDFIHRRKDYTYLAGYRIPDALQAVAQSQGLRFVV